MNKSKNYNYLDEKVSTLKGVGSKIKKLLKKKNIEKISDLLWSLPQGFTDQSNVKDLDSLEIGKVTTIKVKVLKHNFPRIRNLPNKVTCVDEKSSIDIIFFNSREGYLRKVLPKDSWVVISGKINFYKNKYQITNPAYIMPIHKEDYVNQIIPKYSLTEGLNKKVYRKLIEEVLKEIPDLEEWHNNIILEKIGNISWKKSVLNLHKNTNDPIRSDHHKRLAYDEILAHLLVLSQVRKRIKKNKKKIKEFNNILSNKVIYNFSFNLTKNQNKVISEINKDLKSEYKMFRLLQGDVGSGKTIVALIAASNVISSKHQVVMMAPSDILARQHYVLAKKTFESTGVRISFLSGKTNLNERKKIKQNLMDGEIDLLIGTHALFQEGVVYKNLGLAIIDEQHKFGVKQRIALSRKGGRDCDILLMSATPIPRTLVLTLYGDMDVSRLLEKPKNRKDIITLSKPEKKILEVLTFVRKKIRLDGQVFWVCPLIDESKKLDYSAAVKKFKFLSKEFKGQVGLIHGDLEIDKRNDVLKNFLNKNLHILVSTTVIEVGIDFPNANIIVIENSDKFGLSQLHQLRGRVGRGNIQGTCILLYKENLSKNARKRIKILKSSNDGFEIADKDMKLRGFGDVLGYQQSGIKNFKLADPIKHEDLFNIAEKNIKEIEQNETNFKKYTSLIKMFDKSEIINELET